MSSQHLSDEAIAAFADGVLSGHARDRASQHAAGCPECSYAVAVQREAVWALRAAPAPALPTGLLDRLRAVPATTPINVVPTTIGPDGAAMFAAFGTMTSAALSPTGLGTTRQHRINPAVLAAASIAAAGLLAVSTTGQASAQKWKPIRSGPGTIMPAGFVQQSGNTTTDQPGH
ncbi:MAG: zf-HC2 domain-containing protein [Jatrophihabitantaceae bacterium]